MLFDVNVLVIDFETSGLNEHIHSPLTLGAVLLDKNLEKIVDRYYVIKPNKDSLICDPESMRINRLNISELDKGKSVEHICTYFHGTFAAYADVPLLAGWNVHFDVGFLKKMYLQAGIEWPFGYRFLDIQSLALANNKGVSSSLSSEFKRYANGLQITHDALQDALDTAWLLKKYIVK